MKAEYINPFIESSINILGKTTGVLFETGSPSINNGVDTLNDVVVTLGVFGELNGQALLCFKNDFAIALAGNMMNTKLECKALDEIGKSALCELGNMIVGNSATLLFNEGKKVDITTPSILNSMDIKDNEDMLKTINIPLKCGYSAVNLKIIIKEN